MFFWNTSPKKTTTRHIKNRTRTKSRMATRFKTEPLPLYEPDSEMHPLRQKYILQQANLKHIMTNKHNVRPLPESELSKLPEVKTLATMFSQLTLKSSNLWACRDACNQLHVYFSEGEYVPISVCCKSYIEVMFRQGEPLLKCNNKQCNRWISAQGPIFKRGVKRKVISRKGLMLQKPDKLQQISRILDELF